MKPRSITADAIYAVAVNLVLVMFAIGIAVGSERSPGRSVINLVVLVAGPLSIGCLSFIALRHWCSKNRHFSKVFNVFIDLVLSFSNSYSAKKYFNLASIFEIIILELGMFYILSTRRYAERSSGRAFNPSCIGMIFFICVGPAWKDVDPAHGERIGIVVLILVTSLALSFALGRRFRDQDRL